MKRILAVLASNGRFVEISKRDVWDDAAVVAARPDVTYFLVDLAAIDARRTGADRADVWGIDAPHFASAAPSNRCRRRCFPIHEAVDAFRLMQQAKHTGKIVITQPVAEQLQPFVVDGTYLVTGGLGGLGLQTALLVGRAGGTPPDSTGTPANRSQRCSSNSMRWPPTV